ncbi:MAG: acylneuraminate cytidylyltransferase family protein [Vulcanimicrobiota bacterium]
MYKNYKIIALIPARGGSKGLPGKNIKPLLGKPLIAWSVQQAKSAKYIDRIIVSTDNEQIADISKQYGAEIPFMRPKIIAEDSTPMIDVIFQAISFLENQNDKYQLLLLLEPTSPLRKKGDLDNAVANLIENFDNADSLVSLGEIHLEHPYIAKTVDDKYVKPFMNEKTTTQRQQLPKIYFPYGVAYLSKVETLLKEKSFYQKRTIPYFIERWQGYEIDDIYDFYCIETILSKKYGEVL